MATADAWRLRLVDIKSSRYLIARRYMIRLGRSDFADPTELESLARVAGLSPAAFRDQFAYLVANEPTPLQLRPEAQSAE